MKPLGNRLSVRPFHEKRSDVLWTPELMSRWGNGAQCTKGEVVALGPDIREDLSVGDVVHFSDSCGKPAGELLLIREDDVMFVDESETPTKAEWIGAQEVPCEF